jgi:fatty aldehyde-generating acyl-ACP reductase
MNIAFLLHPLNYEDFKLRFKRAYFPFSITLFPFFNFLPPFYIKNFFSMLPPHKIFDINGLESKTGKTISCSFLVLPLFSDQIISLGKEKVKPMLLKSAKIAKKNNAKLLALGAFSSIICNQGEDLVGEVDIAITSGNSLTAALTIDGIIKSAELLNVNIKNSTLAIIGATGDIGIICAKILINKFKKLILCSRKIMKDNSLVKDLELLEHKEIQLETDANNAVKDADFVILATSAFGPIINIENLKKNSVVCDVSLPYNISNESKNERKDVFIFKGGRAKLPFPDKIKNKKWHSLMPNNEIFGCLAEAIVLGFEDYAVNYSIGQGTMTENKINEIRMLAKKHGIELADFSD